MTRAGYLLPLVLGLLMLATPVDRAAAGYRGLTDEHMVGYINSTRVITIDDGVGGHVQGMVRMLSKVAHSSKRVVINGPCRSACTLFLALGPSRVCLTKRAEMWFHQASLLTGKRSRYWSNAMLRLYPAGVRRYVRARGGLQRRWVKLRGHRLHRVFPSSCSGKPSRTPEFRRARRAQPAATAQAERWWGNR
jgi:hypothetical protein